MDIFISNNSIKPIYLQIYEQISAQVISGELTAGFCLPSIRNVAVELGISVITVKNAWEALERNGFIYTVGGKGCYVAELSVNDKRSKQLAAAEEKIRADAEFYKSLGLTSAEIAAILDKVMSGD